MPNFRDGRPWERRLDQDGNGKPELVIQYGPEGLPLKSLHARKQDGVFEEVRIYENGDGVRETVTLLESGRPAVQTQDQDNDGIPEIVIHFDDAGGKKQVELDTSGNGRKDTWEHYQQGALIRVDQDPQGTGRVSTRVFYSKGVTQRSELDLDGRFEVVQRFDQGPWSIIFFKVLAATNDRGLGLDSSL